MCQFLRFLKHSRFLKRSNVSNCAVSDFLNVPLHFASLSAGALCQQGWMVPRGTSSANSPTGEVRLHPCVQTYLRPRQLKLTQPNSPMPSDCPSYAYHNSQKFSPLPACPRAHADQAMCECCYCNDCSHRVTRLTKHTHQTHHRRDDVNVPASQINSYTTARMDQARDLVLSNLRCRPVKQ